MIWMQFHNRQSNPKIAYLGVLAALAILFGYIETLIPFYFGIPGMKLGLANIMTVIALYLFGSKEAFAISVVRILVVGFLFGNPYSIIYSLAGGVLSLLAMIAIKHLKCFSIVGVSIAGGVMHNIGQLLIAMLVVEELGLTFYAPFLIIAGAVTGLLIGLVAQIMNNRLKGVIT
mgnify:CR=1 FL=1